jgi:hypothetical protein
MILIICHEGIINRHELRMRRSLNCPRTSEFDEDSACVNGASLRNVFLRNPYGQTYVLPWKKPDHSARN